MLNNFLFFIEIFKMNWKKILWKIKKICIVTVFFAFNLIFIPNCIYAQDNNDLEVDWFNITPELTQNEMDVVNNSIEEIWMTWWKVWEKYNEIANSWNFTTSQQISSWIMNWDTILHYLVFVVQFLSQLWLVVWAGFIIFAWYKYMLSVFNGWQTKSSVITNAIIWVVIVIFSYAILKALTSMVGLS